MFGSVADCDPLNVSAHRSVNSALKMTYLHIRITHTYTVHIYIYIYIYIYTHFLRYY